MIGDASLVKKKMVDKYGDATRVLLQILFCHANLAPSVIFINCRLVRGIVCDSLMTSQKYICYVDIPDKCGGDRVKVKICLYS